MNFPTLHSWNLTPTQAVALQRELAGCIDIQRPLADWDLIAGADLSYNKFSPTCYAAVVVLRRTDLSVVEVQEAKADAVFPYVPGLLSFRELPLVLEVFGRLQQRPDVVMVDGQGYAHPRRMGLACHLGLWLNLPCLGCAKTRLIGSAREPGKQPGARTLLKDKDEVIGQLVRTKQNVKPLYVSAGHLMDLPSATKVVLETCRGYRLPEPTRQAHLRVNELRRRTEPRTQ